MLVFVSDLHFVDETAGKHNIATEAFRIFFQDIAGNVERYKKNNREIQEIKKKISLNYNKMTASWVVKE